jgi:hypothetical protein
VAAKRAHRQPASDQPRNEGLQHLERREVTRRESVGEAGPSPVHEDQSREAGEALEEPCVGWVFPSEVQVADEAGEECDIDGAVAHDLVGEGGVAVPRVVNLWCHVGES